MKIVTLEDKKKMNELYLELKTYAAVARATGFSPSTVKKYIDPEYQPSAQREIKTFDKKLSVLTETEAIELSKADWDKMCELSEDEVEEIKELWGELEI
jgi:transposase-like protein